MTASEIPAVLIPSKPNSAISIYRALKNIKKHLEESIDWDSLSDLEKDSVQAAIDDCEVMMLCVK